MRVNAEDHERHLLITELQLSIRRRSAELELTDTEMLLALSRMSADVLGRIHVTERHTAARQAPAGSAPGDQAEAQDLNDQHGKEPSPATGEGGALGWRGERTADPPRTGRPRRPG